MRFSSTEAGDSSGTRRACRKTWVSTTIMRTEDEQFRDDEDPDGTRRRALSPLLGTETFRPSSATARVEIGAQTAVGATRAHNDQHYLALRLGRSQETLTTSLAAPDLPPPFDEYAYALLVADGLGETGSGAVASRIAVSTLAHLALHYGRWNVRIDDGTAFGGVRTRRILLSAVGRRRCSPQSDR